MKSIQLTILAAIAFILSASAQIKVSDKAVIKTPGVRSEICQQTVEFFLSKSDGITSVKANIKTHTTTVTWLTDRTNIETIRTIIANAGFDADDVEAEEFAYKHLAKECKRPDTTAAKPKPIIH